MNFQHLLYQSLFWRACNFLTAFLLNFFLARFFEASLSGQINFFITVLSLVLLIGSLNFEASLIYFSSDKKIPFETLITVALCWWVIFDIVTFFFAQYLTRTYMSGLKVHSLSLYVFYYLIGSLIGGYYNALFYGQHNFTIPNIATSVCNLLLILCMVALYTWGGKEYLLNYYLIFYFSIFLLQAFALIILFHSSYKKKFRFQLPHADSFKKIARYTAYVMATNLLFFLLYRVDYWLMMYLNKSPEKMMQLGNYIQVSKHANIFLLLSSTIGSVVFSVAPSSKNLDRQDIFKMIRNMLYVGLSGFLFIAFTGHFLFTWLYGVSYIYLYPCLLLLMPGVLTLMMTSITANYLSGIGKIQYNLKGVMIGLSFVVIFDYWLIPIFGIYAAAGVSSAAYLLYSLYMMMRFKKECNTTWQEIFIPQENDFRFFKFIFHAFTMKKL
jgi:O-antigen/teichoic acid export membrane protein